MSVYFAIKTVANTSWISKVHFLFRGNVEFPLFFFAGRITRDKFPVSGADVYVYNNVGVLAFKCFSARNGGYSVMGIRDGEYMIVARDPNKNANAVISDRLKPEAME